jgi:hypothetical protein
MTHELFYVIADADCAAARKAVLESSLRRETQFRNVVYPEVEADFRARGGTTLPALWDGSALHQGLAAVVAGLARAGSATTTGS